MMNPLQILQQYWHHQQFRGNQEAIIHAVLNKQDVLAVLPTGGGKSICFQVPALLMDGVCLVISPLIALMKDQVTNLNQRNIPATSLYSGLTTEEVHQILEDTCNGLYKFLYVSPERLESVIFKSYLPHLNCCLIAVDEAHCVSQWGYDFRPSYMRIAASRYELKQVPIIALTASATPLVQKDIIEKLKLRKPTIFKQSFERANLSYSAFKADSKINKLIDVLNNVPGSSIVYCKSRNEAKSIANLLALQKLSVDYYHAGLTNDERNDKQEKWMNDKVRIMVCTNAFGMGIDKATVRTVVHYDLPECLENYYQEAGRAGRDGQKAYAVLLYNEEDIKRLKDLVAIRFPSFKDIKKVYQALADFLSIPVGSGEGLYYDFDLTAFINHFKLNNNLVLAAIKILEQEGHLSFNQSVFFPPKVVFNVTKTNLEQFEEINPTLEPLIKCLLRSYQGIYDNFTTINEKNIAFKIRNNETEVMKQLKQLNNYGIIKYSPQKDTPQIHFILNRTSVDFLNINHQAYLKRKQLFEERIDTFINYTTQNKVCRSKFIANYFGDYAAKDCNVCDNCLNKKKQPLIGKELDTLNQLIQKYIAYPKPTVKGLMLLFTKKEEDSVWEVLQQLQDEKHVTIDDRGNIVLKGTT